MTCCQGSYSPWATSLEGAIQAATASDPIDLRPSPGPLMHSIGDKIWNASYTPKQRVWLSFFRGEFSPDGKYFAVEIGDLVNGGPEQVWRYNIETQEAIPVSPMPRAEQSTMIRSSRWIDDTFYTTVTVIPKQSRSIESNGLIVTGPFASEIYFKTEGEQTVQVPSFPAEISTTTAKDAESTKVGSYSVVDGEARPHSGGKVDIWRAATKTSKRVFIATTGPWISIDDPPTVIYLMYGSHPSIEFFNLETLHRRSIPLSYPYLPRLLATQRISNGLRIAYSVHGECSGTEPSSEVNPSDRSHNNGFSDAQRTTHLCFFDTSLDESRSTK